MNSVEPRNDFEIQLFGLQRSGNHALAAWICRQFEPPVLFLNNVAPFADPYKTWKHVDLPNTVSLPVPPMKRPHLQWTHGGYSRPGRMEQLRAMHKAALLYSYENLQLSRLAEKQLVPAPGETMGASRIKVRFLIVRDFYNWLASRIKLFETRRVGLDDMPRAVGPHIGLWIVYAREFLGKTSHLTEPEFGIVKINYLKWVRDEGYRKQLLTEAGIEVRSTALDIVPGAGGGSSFDRTSLDGRGDLMKVDERWRYLEQPQWSALMRWIAPRRPAIDALNAEIFGAEANPPMALTA